LALSRAAGARKSGSIILAVAFHSVMSRYALRCRV
jgi:hypothetical protein